MKTRKLKKFRRYIVYLMVRVFYGAVYLLPFRVKSFFGSLIGSLCYLILGRIRKIALSNIKTAFPDISSEQANNLALSSFRNMGRNVFEFLHLSRMSYEKMIRMAEFEGLEHFKSGMKRGKGLIVITGHLGGWEFFQTIMSKSGYPTSVLAQRYSNPWIDRMMTKIREYSGTKVIIRRRGHEKELMKKVLSALKDGCALGILIDHYTRKGGVAVPFLNSETSAPAGPALFSMRTGAPVIFGYAIRKKDGTFKVIFLPLIKAVNSNERNRALYLNTSRFLAAVESEITEHPEQWAWMHDFRREHKKGVRRISFDTLPVVEIYSKKNCCLCDEAKEQLDKISVRYPFRMKVVDITSDSGKLAQYGSEIPVVFIDGKKTSKLKFDKVRFEEKIIERLAEG